MTRLVLTVLILASATARAEGAAALEGGSSPEDVWEQIKASPHDLRTQLELVHPKSRRHMIINMLQAHETIIKKSSGNEIDRAHFEDICRTHGIDLEKVPKSGPKTSKLDRKKLLLIVKRVKDPIQCVIDMTEWVRKTAGSTQTLVAYGELQNVEKRGKKVVGEGTYGIGMVGIVKNLEFRKLRDRWYLYTP